MKKEEAIERLKQNKAAAEIYAGDDWIPVSDRLPECEQEVLICTETKIIGRNAYVDSIITPALYEDGTMPEYDSKWAWELEDSCAEWDEKEGCYIVPEGWWENRHFYCNNIAVPVDQKVIAWQPLPEPYKGEVAQIEI